MALQLTGSISFQDLLTEFKTGTPISFQQMYAGAGFVPEANKGVPKSGTISLGNFYGATAAFVLDYNVTADMLNLNSSTILANSSWDGVIPVILTINVSTGIVVSGNSTATPAMVINALPEGSQVFINNSGYIIGMGGAGGAGTSGYRNGSRGGTALSLSTPTRVNNLGTIGGGGGGGTGVEAQSGKNSGGGGGRSGRQASSGGSASSSGGAGTFNGAGGGGRASGGWGGDGGNWGASGGRIDGSASVGAGGAAVVGNSYATWINTGTIAGALT